MTPYTMHAFGFTSAHTGVLFAVASGCTLLVSIAIPACLRRTTPRAILLVPICLLGGSCVGMTADSSAAFVAMLLLFFAAYAASQTGLFCAFYERYCTHPRCAEFTGYISAAGSAGRCAGPLWAV